MVKVLFILRPDIVHSFTPKAGLISMLAAWITRRPVRIHTFTGLVFPTSNGFKHILLKNCDRIISFCATTVIPEGNGVRNDLISYGITKKPMKVIGYGNIAGIDTFYFSRSDEVTNRAKNFRALNQIEPGHSVFCFVGRLNRDKGLKELVNAFESLPANARLLIVGEEDSTAPIPVSTLHKIRSDSRIILTGFQEDIRPFLAASDVAVLPSYREGFPNFLLQAGSMGLPSIATNINGSNEIIIDNVNGWIVPPKDIDQLRDAMLRIYTIPAHILKKIGDDARSRVVSHFDQTLYRRRLVDFYQSLISLDS